MNTLDTIPRDETDVQDREIEEKERKDQKKVPKSQNPEKKNPPHTRIQPYRWDQRTLKEPRLPETIPKEQIMEEEFEMSEIENTKKKSQDHKTRKKTHPFTCTTTT